MGLKLSRLEATAGMDKKDLDTQLQGHCKFVVEFGHLSREKHLFLVAVMCTFQHGISSHEC